MTGRITILTSVVLLGSACGQADRVASVGGTVLTEADLDVAVRRAGDEARGFDALIETSLLAEGARAAGLMDDESVRARLRDAERQVLSQALLEKALAGATDESALRKRYEEGRSLLERRRVHVAHIFFQPGGESPTKIATSLSRLRAGDSFADVARELSDDRVSGARGGELPAIDDGTTDPAFFEAAWKLQAGETSDVVTTRFGAHIIRAISGPRQIVPSFEEARGRVEAESMKDARAALLQDLKESHPVKRSERRATKERSGSQ